MNAVSITACSLAVLMAAPMLLAQPSAPPPLMVGPSLGAAAISDRTRLGVYAGSFDCGAFESGSGLRISAGGEIILPSLFGERFGLAGAFVVDRLAGLYTATPTEPARVLGRDGGLVELQREYRRSYRELATAVRVAAEYSPLDRWRIGLGAELRCVMSATYDQREVVLGPGAYAFADGAHEHPVGPGDPLRRVGLAVEPQLSLAYALPLSSSLTLRPRASLAWEITAPGGVGLWRRAVAGGSLALLFSLPRVEPLPVAPAPPRPPVLAASLSMSGVDDAGNAAPIASVDVNEVIARDVAPLLPAVFFDRDADALPSRYRAIDRDDAHGFSPAGLAGIGVYELQHLTLDVIGERLLDHPCASVTLTGRVSEGEMGELGRRRAEFVGDYLQRAWGIGRDRIALAQEGRLELSSERTEDGRADNRRVELASDVDAILSPVVAERVEQTFDPPVVRLDPSVVAAAGVRRWSLVVTQGGDTVGRFGGDGPAGLARTDMSWRVDADAHGLVPPPLVAEMVVEDSSGAVATARSVTPMVLRRHVRTTDGRVEGIGNRERVSYALVGFGFDDDRLSPGDESMVREIASMTRPRAVVTITGHTDRIGDPARNLLLSSARARNVALMMGSAIAARNLSDVKIEESGAADRMARFTNETPEGRMLSRGVSIVVEQDAGEASVSDVSRSR
jgi:outer membrane protein OmpA-like peptidoglycan-associated protein